MKSNPDAGGDQNRPKIPRGRNGGRKSSMPANMPKEACDAFHSHRAGAKTRGIDFKMTPAEWWAWWQTDSRWLRRGKGGDTLCMARRGDAGPYAIGNVYCATKRQNSFDAWANGRSAGRPRKLSASEVARAKVLLDAGGLTVTQIAGRFGVSRDTLYEYFPGGRSALPSGQLSFWHFLEAA